MHGFTSNNKAVLLYCSSIINKIIDIATQEGQGGPCKRLRYSNREVGNLNKAHGVVKVVYDEFMKQIRAVRHSFNTTTTHMANYKVQLAAPST